MSQNTANTNAANANAANSMFCFQIGRAHV